jgi:hypothetical protein
VAIDSLTETVFTFGAAARRIPSLRSGKPVSPSTIWRWSTTGCRARNGQRVRLETIKIGGSTCTSAEALDRFFRALSGEQEIAQAAPHRGSKEHEESEARLEVVGI